MSRVVISGEAPYDVFVGRGSCPLTGEASRWALPQGAAAGTRRETERRFRRWLWGEVCAGRVEPAELVGLHGKVFGVSRKAWEGWHVGVLEAAAMWAFVEQARRLEVRLGELLAARRRAAVRQGGESLSARSIPGVPTLTLGWSTDE